MSKLTQKRIRKIGLPSGTLVYTGEKKDISVKMHLIDYDEKGITEMEIENVESCLPYKNRPSVLWINSDGVHNIPLLEKLGECFGLHRLVMEDIVNIDQRSKIEDYEDFIYIVIKMIFTGKAGEIITEQTSIILGGNYVLSFQEGAEGDVFDILRDSLRSGKGRIRKMGADYLAYALLDAVVDNYFSVLQNFGNRIELLETELIEEPSQHTVRKIYQLKRELIFLHNAVWPLREAISSLWKHESGLIKESTAPYLRDVYDHVGHVIDSVYIYREMISSMLDMYLSSVSYRLNSVMKVLTIIATIFMPLTFIVGLYGMNFRHMPELEWVYGYPLVLLLMALIAGFMLFYFKRKKWL